MTHPLLYEIHTRCWLRRLSAEIGRTITLANVPEIELDRWSRWGLTHLWLMGVWTSGPRARALALAEPHQRRAYDDALPGWQPDDVDGSPYAIAAYHVDPALGDEAGLALLRRRLHARSIRLILDFVPNHLGLDHPWVRQFPDRFVQSPVHRPGTFQEATDTRSRWLAHGRDPYFPPWTDTVQLDYRRDDTRAAMTALLASVAERCDGVRCDMAMLLLGDVFARTWQDCPPVDGTAAETGEFWAQALAGTRCTHPDFQFLAEAYWGLESRLQDLGFDYTYDKELTDKVMARDGPAVQRHLLDQPAWRLAAGIHFLENHDERRVASVLAIEAHQAATLLMLGLPGMRFLHDGQLEGAGVRVPVQLNRRPAEPPQPVIAAWYRRLLAVLAASAVGTGTPELLTPLPVGEAPCTDLVLVEWQAPDGAIDLVAVNLAAAPRQAYAPLHLGDRAAENWSIVEAISGTAATRSGAELRRDGLPLDLPPHAAALYQCRPA